MTLLLDSSLQLVIILDILQQLAQSLATIDRQLCPGSVESIDQLPCPLA